MGRRTRNSREYMPSWNGASSSSKFSSHKSLVLIFGTKVNLFCTRTGAYNSYTAQFNPLGGPQDAQFERVHAELERRFKQQQQLLLKNRMCAYVLITVPRVSLSCELFQDGFDLHLLHYRGTSLIRKSPPPA